MEKNQTPPAPPTGKGSTSAEKSNSKTNDSTLPAADAKKSNSETNDLAGAEKSNSKTNDSILPAAVGKETKL